MTQYEVCAWWTSQYGVFYTVEAKTPDGAIAIVEKMERDAPGAFYDDNRRLPDSDGPTSFEIHDGGEVLAESLSDEERLNRAAAGLRTALTDFVGWAAKASDGDDGCDYLNGDSDKYSGDGWEDMEKLAETARAVLAKTPGGTAG